MTTPTPWITFEWAALIMSATADVAAVALQRLRDLREGAVLLAGGS